MKRAMLEILILLGLPALSACGVTLGPQAVRETTWARMGTPGRIVDDREVEVLVPDGAGGWKRSSARLEGLCVLDEPTLEYYRGLDAKQGKE
jgi:hypothetical protein